MKEVMIAELLKLSPAERIQLAEDLWDSLCEAVHHCSARRTFVKGSVRGQDMQNGWP
jgi:hypothetical protein